jgi:trimeric autotransporter adhesin
MRPLILLSVLLLACPSEPVEPAATLIGLEVDPTTLDLPAGLSASITAWTLYDDDTRIDRTDTVEWISSSPQFADLDPEEPGRVTGTVTGTTAISATLEGFAAACVVQVLDASVEELVVTPLDTEVALGGTIDYVAIGVLSDGGQADVTASVLWTSSVEDVATFDEEVPQRLRAVSPGVSTVRAAVDGFETSVSVEVVDRELVELTLTPGSIEVPVGLVGSVSARALWSDGAADDVSSQVVWSSTNTEVATVSNGTVTTIQTGTTLVEARFQGHEDDTLVTVLAASEVGLEVAPGVLELILGEPGSLTATVRLSDGGEEDVTTDVQWVSDAPGVASAGNDVGREGIVSSIGQGSATITATRGALTASAGITVGAPQLTELAVDPDAVELAIGDTVAFLATGTFSDGSSTDLTGSSTWSLDPLGLALINSLGEVTPLAEGTVTATATSGSFSAGAEITIVAAELRSVAVTPVGLRLPVGAVQAMTATGTWSDGVISDVTSDVFWGSSAPGFATVTNLPGSEGLVEAHAVGVTTMQAAFGAVSGAVSMEVVPSAPDLLELSGPSTLTVAETAPLTLEVTWTDGSTSSEAAEVAWSSDDPAVLTTSNDSGTEGVVFAAGSGSATVSAVFEGESATLVIDVVDPS